MREKIIVNVVIRRKTATYNARRAYSETLRWPSSSFRKTITATWIDNKKREIPVPAREDSDSDDDWRQTEDDQTK